MSGGPATAEVQLDGGQMKSAHPSLPASWNSSASICCVARGNWLISTAGVVTVTTFSSSSQA